MTNVLLRGSRSFNSLPGGSVRLRRRSGGRSQLVNCDDAFDASTAPTTAVLRPDGYPALTVGNPRDTGPRLFRSVQQPGNRAPGDQHQYRDASTW